MNSGRQSVIKRETMKPGAMQIIQEPESHYFDTTFPGFMASHLNTDFRQLNVGQWIRMIPPSPRMVPHRPVSSID
jgi:hypothetical protein